MIKEIQGAKGWRYCIQREQVRGEGPLYSIMVAPPYMQVGYLTGYSADRAIKPIVNDSMGTKSSVMAVIERHRKYILNR